MQEDMQIVSEAGTLVRRIVGESNLKRLATTPLVLVMSALVAMGVHVASLRRKRREPR